MKTYTVKARERHGTNSLDITLPAELKKEYGISKGDIFKIDVTTEDNTIKFIYTLIFKNKK